MNSRRSQLNAAYKWEIDLRRHVITAHTPQKFPCDQCNAIFTESRSLRSHIKHVHDKIPRKCSAKDCDFQTTRTDALRSHILKNHLNKVFSCDHCNYKTVRRPDMKRHFELTHLKLFFECFLCDYKHRLRYNVRKHVQRCHTEQNLTSTNNSLMDISNMKQDPENLDDFVGNTPSSGQQSSFSAGKRLKSELKDEPLDQVLHNLSKEESKQLTQNLEHAFVSMMMNERTVLRKSSQLKDEIFDDSECKTSSFEGNDMETEEGIEEDVSSMIDYFCK